MKQIFNYADNKKIVLAEETTRKTNSKAIFESLTDQDIFAIKSIYEFEYVNTNMIHRYLKDRLPNYNFKNRIKKYINLGFIRSYYIVSADNERSSNIHILTNEAVKLIESHFLLDGTNKNYICIPTDKDILCVVKRLALNHFLIGSNDFIKEYKLFNNPYFDALVNLKDYQSEFYVKVLRPNNNNSDEMYSTLQRVDSLRSKYKKVIFMFEDLGHLEEVARPYLLPKYREKILFIIDKWFIDSPSFITIEYPEENCKIYRDIGICKLKD